MTLEDLLDRHDKCREQLINAINRDADQAEIQQIDARLASLITAIENLDLHDPQDIKQQIGFFLTQSEVHGDGETSSANIRSAQALVSRYANHLGTQKTGLDNDDHISSQLKITVNGQDFSSKEMIQPDQSRVSLFSTEFRYQFTSVGNARYYQADPSEFVGKHLLDVIGKQRFMQRAKNRLEQCFSGVEQRYFHFLPNPSKGERLMDIHMAPYYDNDNSVRGAYVAVEDITDKFENARQTSHAI